MGLNGRDHYCAGTQGRFTDVGAMVTALARGLGDPKLKATLETPYGRRDTPADIVIPIADLLSKDGHRSCEGLRLAGEPKIAEAARRSWAKERRDWLRQHGTLDGFTSEPPQAERIPTFEGGTIRFRIWHNKDRTGYEISSFYPEAATEKGSVVS